MHVRNCCTCENPATRSAGRATYGGDVRYFIPDVQLGSALPPQDRFDDKIGGVPFGLPLDLWPLCASCGNRQTLLAQYRHDRERLDLLGEGRVLHVFRCQNEPRTCAEFDPDSGCNAAFIVEAATLGNRLTLPPKPVPTFPEARVRRWLRRRVGFVRALRMVWGSGDWEWRGLRGIFPYAAAGTRVGGRPAWIQDAQSPGAGWRFLGQFSGICSSWQPLPPRELRGGVRCHLDSGGPEGRRWWASTCDFGDSGLGYVFLKPTDGMPQCRFLWQCC